MNREIRTEEPYVSWLSTGGTVSNQYGLYGRFGDDPLLEGRWIAPEEADEGTWYGIVRDRRGGTTWSEVEWTAE